MSSREKLPHPNLLHPTQPAKQSSAHPSAAAQLPATREFSGMWHVMRDECQHSVEGRFLQMERFRHPSVLVFNRRNLLTQDINTPPQERLVCRKLMECGAAQLIFGTNGTAKQRHLGGHPGWARFPVFLFSTGGFAQSCTVPSSSLWSCLTFSSLEVDHL